MAFEAENDLERALMRAPSDPAARPEFYRLLLDSPLHVLGTSDDNNRMTLGIAPHKGRNYHLVFTSVVRLREFLKNPEKYLTMTGRDLFAATKGAYFMLNPGADFGKELLPEEIASLLSPPAAKSVEIDAGTTMLIAQAKEPPKVLMDALSHMFRTHKEVRAAYIAHVSYGDEPHPVIGVDTEGEWDAIATEIGRVIDGVRPDTKVDAVPVGRGGTLSDSLLKYTPFYRR